MSEAQDVKSVGQVARQLRLLRGLSTQAAFAGRLGVSRAALANYETGRTIPSEKTLQSFREALDLGEQYFSDNPFDQMMLSMGLHTQPGDGFSPDERAILQILRVVPTNSVRDALTVVLNGLRSGVGITRTKDPDALHSAVERVMHIVADNGRYDRTPRDAQRDDKLQAVLSLLDRGLPRDSD